MQRYRLLYEIGAGGMGVVYEGRKLLHDGGELPVAIKVMHGGLAREEQEQAAELFKREGATSLAVNHGHENLVTTFDYDVSATGRAFLVMELVDGISVDVARAAGPVPFAVVRRIARDVLSALSYMHAHEVIHRDVTPGNILLSREGVIKLADFGLVEHAYRSGSRFLRGTPEYSSVEALHGHALTGKADLYSLGVVLYELLTGRRPYGPGSPGRLVEAMMTGDPEPLPDGTPRDLVELVRGLMRLDIERAEDTECDDRFETADDVLAWLDAQSVEIADDRAIRALVAERAPDVQPRRGVLPALGWPFEPGAPWKRSAPVWLGWAAVPIAFLLGLGVFGLVFDKPEHTRAPNNDATPSERAPEPAPTPTPTREEPERVARQPAPADIATSEVTPDENAPTNASPPREALRREPARQDRKARPRPVQSATVANGVMEIQDAD